LISSSAKSIFNIQRGLKIDFAELIRMEKKTRKTETLGIQSSQEGPLGYAESPYSRPGSLDRDT